MVSQNPSTHLSADHVIRLANSLRFGDGPMTGKTLTLRLWQEQLYQQILDPDVETAAVWMNKKNGKTMLMAILILSHLIHGLANRLSPEVYSGSGTGVNQAALVFRAVAGFIRQSPALGDHLWVRENIYRIESRDRKNPGFYKCVVADADKLDGPNPSLFVMDEVHRGGKQTESIWETMVNGMAQRPNPLAVSISTAGVYDPESFAWKLYNRSKKIRDKVWTDPSFLPVIYEHNGDVPWDDGEEAVWSAYAKCNPGAGDFIKESFIRSLIRKALDLPSKRPSFERFFLGIWTNDAETFIGASDWSGGQEAFSEADLEGRDCYLGGDLAWAEDMSAVVFVFPMDDGSVRLIVRYWVPGESLAQREKLSGAPLSAWVQSGHLQTFAGGTTDFDVVFDYISDCHDRFNILGVAHDPVGTADIWRRCSDELGLDVMKFSPKPWSMNDPIRSFEAAVLDCEVQHNGHPVLAWNVSNAMAKTDGEDRVVLVKRSRHQNIDGLDGAVLGHAMMKRGPNQGKNRRRVITDTQVYVA